MKWTDREIAAWMDELLPAARMTEFETDLRSHEPLRLRVTSMIRNRDQGGNSIGEVWQRTRLSCPTRSELGGYLLGTLPSAAADYLEFHIRTIGCRLCDANLADLEAASTSAESAAPRRRRFFESSAGLLRPEPESF